MDKTEASFRLILVDLGLKQNDSSLFSIFDIDLFISHARSQLISYDLCGLNARAVYEFVQVYAS